MTSTLRVPRSIKHTFWSWLSGKYGVSLYEANWRGPLRSGASHIPLAGADERRHARGRAAASIRDIARRIATALRSPAVAAHRPPKLTCRAKK